MAKDLKYFYPSRSENKWQPILKQLVDKVGHKYYKDKYNVEFGTVKKEKNIVNENELIFSKEDLNDKDIHFYLSKNKYHERGDGLIIMSPLIFSNLFYYIRKKILKPYS